MTQRSGGRKNPKIPIADVFSPFWTYSPSLGTSKETAQEKYIEAVKKLQEKYA